MFAIAVGTAGMAREQVELAVLLEGFLLRALRASSPQVRVIPRGLWKALRDVGDACSLCVILHTALRARLDFGGHSWGCNVSTVSKEG